MFTHTEIVASTLLGPLERTNLNQWTTHVEVEDEVDLRPTVSRPV
jgi:hypothetical protein